MCVVVPCGVDYKRVVANRRTSARYVVGAAESNAVSAAAVVASRARVKIRRRERAVSVSVASNSTEAESGGGRTGTRDEERGRNPGPVRPRLSDPERPRLSVRFALSPPPVVSGILLGAFTLEPAPGIRFPPRPPPRASPRPSRQRRGGSRRGIDDEEDGVQRVLLHEFDVAEHVIGVHRSIELGVEQPDRLHHVLQRVGALEVESEGGG